MSDNEYNQMNDWWNQKIKDGFEQGVSAEYCAWQEVKSLRQRVYELESEADWQEACMAEMVMTRCPSKTSCDQLRARVAELEAALENLERTAGIAFTENDPARVAARAAIAKAKGEQL